MKCLFSHLRAAARHRRSPERHIQNLSALSHESLVGELLSPPIPESTAVVLADAAPTYLSIEGANVATDEDRLQRKLTVARELLLRDLHARMQTRPMMDSPQVLREWLRLYCAGLEHEVFIGIHLLAFSNLQKP